MATTQAHRCVTLPANASLASAQFLFGVVTNSSGTGRVVSVSVSGARVDGVIMNNPSAAGDAVEFAIDGVVKVVAGAAVTAGVEVMSDASGRAIAVTATNQIAGIALKSAGAAGEIIPVLLKSGGTK